MVSDPVAATDWRQLATDTKISDGMFIGGKRWAAWWASSGSTAMRKGTWLFCSGGVKLSGLGRDKSRHAVEEYTYLKTTWIRYA